MAEPRRAAKAGASSDGVRITVGRRSRKEILLLVAATLLVGLAVLGVGRWFLPGPAPSEPSPAAPGVAAAPEQRDAQRDDMPAHVDAKPRHVRPTRADAAPPESPPDAAAAPSTVATAPPDTEEASPADGGPPTHEEPPFTVGPPGSGIAAFPPPGSDPIKVGIVVPDDFELPEGFVRHYQVTDDGQELPPILMFNPDYEWIDANGQRVEIPADHIVPPELAPPGLPIRMLEVPKKPEAP